MSRTLGAAVSFSLSCPSLLARDEGRISGFCLLGPLPPTVLNYQNAAFNSSLGGNARRAIDIHEGEEIDANAFKALIRAAVALNTSSGKKSTKRK